MLGRTGFWGDLWYSIGVSGFLYPIFGHWAWGPDGWLNGLKTPFHDFAGSTVVHTIGGMIAIAVSFLVFPERAHGLAIEASARLLELMAAALGELLDRFARNLDAGSIQHMQDNIGEALGRKERA